MDSEKINGSQVSKKQLTLREATVLFREFVKQRNWQAYHTPRNLILAMMGEIGELAQIFQWKGEVKNQLPEFTAEQKTHVGQEISDVMSYLFRLADVCDIDITKAIQDKVQKNRRKYPQKQVSGNLDLINQYKQAKKKEALSTIKNMPAETKN